MKNFKTHFWQVGKISFPLTLATASGTLLIFIDSFFATRVSIETYEAVFLTLPIMGLATGIGVGLAAAIADMVSKEKDLWNIKRLVAASVVLSFVSIIGFLYLSIFHADWIEGVAGLDKLESSSPIIIEFRDYWSVILWTFPMQIFFALTIQFLTILEKQRAGMYVIILILVLNIFLDYLFTQVFPWGGKGLAYSTMGVFTAGVLLSYWPMRKEPYFQLPYPSIFNKTFLSVFLKLTSTTLMIFVAVGIFGISAIILNRIALDISTSALIIFAVYSQIMQVIIITTRGLAGGFIIYLGNAIRDKNASEYFPIYWASTAWIAIFNLLGALLMITIPTTLINFFDNIDLELYPEIIYFQAVGALILTLFILPRLAFIGFISVNKSYLLVAHSVLFVAVQLTAAYHWTAQIGVRGLVHAELLAAVINSIVFVLLFFYFLNQLKKQDYKELENRKSDLKNESGNF